MMGSVANALDDVRASDKPAGGLESILDNIQSLSSPATVGADLKEILQAILDTNTGVVQTRNLIGKLITTLRSTENHDLWIDVGQQIVSGISQNPTTASSFLDQTAAVCELIATAQENNEDYLAAAKTLSEITLDSSQRRVPDEDKVKIWIRIVRNYLEAENSASAETYLNKLKNVMHTITDPELNLHFKLSSARIQDSKREFLAAAQSYHGISMSNDIAEEERLHTLAMAIKCAILAPAGPPRSRVLSRLYKDERSAGLEEYGILEKIFLDRLLAPAEVEKFAQGLQEHQLAITADGSTVLQKAVVEHNLLGTSRLYSNIGFDALGLLLGLDGDKAEETTSRMIEQGRLAGRIDQIDRTIYFEGIDASGEKPKVVVGKVMRRWDANIQALAEELEQVTNSLQAEFPVSEYFESHSGVKLTVIQDFVEQQLARAA
jgi:COP9 signalosome complex subunit 4